MIRFAVNPANANALKTITAVTNMVKLDLKEAHFCQYKVSYEFLENAVDGGDKFKEEAQYFLLRAIEKSVVAANAPDKEQQLDNIKRAVVTGSAILLPKPLPLEESYTTEYSTFETNKKTKARIERKYRLTLSADGEGPLQLPEHTSFINNIVGAALLCGVYSSKDGSSFINPSAPKEYPRDHIVAYNAVVPSAMRCISGGATNDALQLDVSVKAASMENCEQVMSRLRYRPREIAEKLVGQRATTLGGKSDTVKIKSATDLFNKSPAGLKKDPTKTFVEYFKQKYNINLNPEGRVLLCRPLSGRNSRPMHYPAELLRPLVLDERQTSRLPFICGIYPEERMQRVKDAFDSISRDPKVTDFLKAYGVAIPNTELLRVRGSLVATPKVWVPGVQAPVDPNAFTGQQGFAQALGRLTLQGCTEFAKFSRLVASPSLLAQPVLVNALKKYRVGLPQATGLDITPASVPKAGAFACVQLHDLDSKRYNEMKTALCKNGVVSQCVVKAMDRSIPDMIAQQMAAKIGQLCFMVDVNELGEGFASGPVLLVGVDVGSNWRDETVRGRTVRQYTHTISFVAFLAEGKKWRPFCNHQHVAGSEQLLYADSAAATSESSESKQQQQQRHHQNAGGIRENATDVLRAHFAGFLKEVKRHFGLASAKPGSVVVYRGCTSNGEVAAAESLADDVKAEFGKWNYAVMTAQARSHTRFAMLPPSPNCPVQERTNVPRGFCTCDFIDVCLTGAGKGSKKAFYLTGAFCCLGHASNTLYVVLASSGIGLPALQKLTFALCFMYPNKPDALPLPLPMKCAAEYARKFSVLPDVKTLHESMKPTMHYL